MFDHIINVIDSDDSGKTYLVMCAYIEIYNEEVRDLLGDNPHERLDLKEDPNKVNIKYLTKFSSYHICFIKDVIYTTFCFNKFK